MLILMAATSVDDCGDELSKRLAAIRPQAWPNSRLVRYADEQLGRNGALVTALQRHYHRQAASQPYLVDWMTRLGRVVEVEMARAD